jgi:hypothetical protein
MKTLINIILVITCVLAMLAIPSCGKGDDRYERGEVDIAYPF